MLVEKIRNIHHGDMEYTEKNEKAPNPKHEIRNKFK